MFQSGSYFEIPISIMASKITRSSGRRMLRGVEFIERQSFRNGKLPTRKEVLEMMLFICHPVRSGREVMTRKTAARIVAKALKEHWLFCNVSTVNSSYSNHKCSTVIAVMKMCWELCFRF